MPRSLIPPLNFWDVSLTLTGLALVVGLIFPLSLAASIPVFGLCLYSAYCFSFKTSPPLAKSLALWLIMLLALMGLSSLWSINPDESFNRFIKTTPLVVTSYLFYITIRQCPYENFTKFKNFFLCAILVIGSLICIELNFFVIKTHDNLYIAASNLNKNSALFMLLIPCCFYLLHRTNKLYLIAFTALTIALFISTESQSSQLAGLVMIATSIGMLPFLRTVTKFIIITGLIALAILMPFISTILFDLVETQKAETSIVPLTGLTRLENWDFIAREIFKSPWYGHGMDATRYMNFTTEQLFFKDTTIVHPHNGFLQIWIETGISGALLMVLGLGLYAARKTNILHFVIFTGASTILLLSWSIWSAWLIASLFFIAGFSALAVTGRNAPRQP